jgi:hypothetical protein
MRDCACRILAVHPAQVDNQTSVSRVTFPTGTFFCTQCCRRHSSCQSDRPWPPGANKTHCLFTNMCFRPSPPQAQLESVVAELQLAVDRCCLAAASLFVFNMASSGRRRSRAITRKAQELTSPLSTCCSASCTCTCNHHRRTVTNQMPLSQTVAFLR